MRRAEKLLVETGVCSDIASALETAIPTSAFRPQNEPSRAQILAAGHARGGAATTREFEKTLEARAIKGPDEVFSGYLTMKSEISTIDRMIKTTDKRRGSVLSNVDARRKLLGRDPDAWDIV